MTATALRLIDTTATTPEHEQTPVVDAGVAAGLIHTWAAVQTTLLERQIRRSGALQRYVRGSVK